MGVAVSSGARREAAYLTVIENAFVTLWPALFVALTSKIRLPAIGGVPVMSPFAARFRPVGNVVPLISTHELSPSTQVASVPL